MTTSALSAPLPLLRSTARPLAGSAWVDVATMVVVFLLYSNAPAIAVKFHGVPFIVGAMAILPLFLPLAYYLLVRRQPIVVTPALPLVVLFIIVATISAIGARDLDRAQKNLFEELQGVVLYVLAINVVRTEATLRRVVWTLVLAGSLLGALSLHQQLTQSFDSQYGGFAQIEELGFFRVQTDEGSARQARLAGPIGEKNRYAQMMLMLVPLGFMQLWGERSRLTKVFLILGTALTTVGFTLAFSRGAALAFLLTLALMTMMGYFKVRHVAYAIVGVMLTLAVFPQYSARLASIGTVASSFVGEDAPNERLDGAVTGRLTEMRAALLAFADHPVVGVGLGMFPTYAAEYGNAGGMKLIEGNRQAHNLFLGIAAETGALGLACFLGMFVVTLRRLTQTRRQCLTDRPALASMATGFMLVLVIYLTTGLNAHFSYTRYFWLMLGLAGAAGALGPAPSAATARLARPLAS